MVSFGGPTTVATPVGTATTVVGSMGPVGPSSFGPARSELPNTGKASTELALLGAALFGLGVIGMALARRTHPTNS